MARVPKKWIRNDADQLAVERGCTFDLRAAEHVRDFFAQFIRQSIGQWDKQPLTLLPWEWEEWIAPLYGWKRPDGRRRFTSAHIQTGKKNGKSTVLSAIDIYHLVADGENVPLIYNIGCDKSHAADLFGECKRMVEASPELLERLEVIDGDSRIVYPARNGKIITASKVVESKEGKNCSLVVLDDFHRQANDRMFKMMRYAGSARRQPLRIVASNAGTTDDVARDSVCYRQYKYSKAVVKGTIPDITHLTVIHEPDDPEKCDINNPKNWYAANPSLGITLDIETFKHDLESAKADPSELDEFKQLRMSIWVANRDRYLPESAWSQCGQYLVDEPALHGRRAWGGLDLASTKDLTAFALLVVDYDGNPNVIFRHWIPEDTVASHEHDDRVPYMRWIEEGYLRTTPGEVADYAFIRRDIVDLCSQYEVEKILSDRWNATAIVTCLREQDGLNVEFLGQGFASLSAPTKELLRLTLSDRLRPGDNPLVNWQAANAIAQRDAAGNEKLDKKKSSNKIDGLAALVNAIAGWIADEDPNDEGSVYESRGALVF